MDYIKTKSIYCISYITLKTGVMGTVEEDKFVVGENIFCVEKNEETLKAYKEYKVVVKDSELELWVDLNKLNRIIKDYKNLTREFRKDKNFKLLVDEQFEELEKTKELCREIEGINRRLEERLVD